MTYIFIEGSLEAKLPTIWTDGNKEVRRVKEEKKRSEKIREEKDKKEDAGMQVREKVGKPRFTVFFPMFCGSGSLLLLVGQRAKHNVSEKSCADASLRGAWARRSRVTTYRCGVYAP